MSARHPPPSARCPPGQTRCEIAPPAISKPNYEALAKSQIKTRRHSQDATPENRTAKPCFNIFLFSVLLRLRARTCLAVLWLKFCIEDQGVQGMASQALRTRRLAARRINCFAWSPLCRSHPVSRVMRSAAKPRERDAVTIWLLGLQQISQWSAPCPTAEAESLRRRLRLRL